MYKNLDYRTSSNTNKTVYPSKAGTSSKSGEISIVDMIVCALTHILAFLRSDAFTAGFIGVSILLIIGIVGGIEFGLLGLFDGGIYAAVILSAVSIVMYLNRDDG